MRTCWSRSRATEREQKAALARSTTPAITCGTNWQGGLNLRKIPELHFEPGPGADVANRVETVAQTGEKITPSNGKSALN